MEEKPEGTNVLVTEELPPGTKKCSHCKQVLPKAQFSGRKASRDGLSYTCKACERKAAMESYERRKKKRAEHKRYMQVRERRLEQSRENYKKHHAMRLAQAKEYRMANPIVYKSAGARRRARLKEGRVPYKRFEIIERDSVDGIPICQICLKEIFDLSELHIDHILPLVAGGKDTPENVRVVCSECNLNRPQDGRDVSNQARDSKGKFTLRRQLDE